MSGSDDKAPEYTRHDEAAINHARSGRESRGSLKRLMEGPKKKFHALKKQGGN